MSGSKSSHPHPWQPSCRQWLKSSALPRTYCSPLIDDEPPSTLPRGKLYPPADGVRLALILPRRLRVGDQKRIACRDMNHDIGNELAQVGQGAVIAPGFKDQNLDCSILAQAIGNHAASGTAAHNNI